MKTLEKYLKENGLKPTPWAIDNKIAPSVISRHINGKNISKDNALKIQKATNGAVTAMELLYPEKLFNPAHDNPGQ